MKSRNKNKIENNKDIIFTDQSSEYTSVTGKNQQFSQPISISSRIIPLTTPTSLNQTQVPLKATAHKLSHAQVAKQVTSTASSYCNESVDNDEKIRAHDSHSANSRSSNATFIAIPNVQLLPAQLPSIVDTSPLCLSLESPRLNAHTVTEYHILNSNHHLNSNANDASSYCVDNGLLTIENGDTLDSHKNNYLSHSKLEVPKSFKYINISEANDPRSVEAIICNKKQCRMLDLNIPTTNMLTCYKQILPSKCNTVKHTVQETTKSNTNQLLKRKTIRKDTLQYNLTQKKINIRKDTAQYDHIRRKTNDDSILPILLLICKKYPNV